MTQTTDSRQIRSLVNSILKSYGIDDLALEANLSSAFLRYLQERIASKDVDKANLRIAILEAMQIGAEKQTRNEQMESRIFKSTGLYVNETWYTAGVIDFLFEQDAKGRTIEDFAQACRDDPFTMPKLFEIGKKPEYLKTVFGMAFVGKEDVLPYEIG